MSDLVAVGFAGVVGMGATWFDMRVDAVVRQQLDRLKKTDVLSGWESDGRGLSIDYTGPCFGGPAHRVRSAGHDLGRPLQALRQLRDGEFRGVRWVAGRARGVREGRLPRG